MISGDALGAAFGVPTFEGARGYFVVFLVIPLFAVSWRGSGRAGRRDTAARQLMWMPEPEGLVGKTIRL